MSRRQQNAWLRVGWDAWWLGVEASMVIGQRMLRMAAGGAAASTEARRMLAEKVQAGVALQTAAMTGQLGLTSHTAAKKTIRHYRKRVRANRRRLAKPHR
jgi:ABC-type sugar transport system substrate-binding protein